MRGEGKSCHQSRNTPVRRFCLEGNNKPPFHCAYTQYDEHCISQLYSGAKRSPVETSELVIAYLFVLRVARDVHLPRDLEWGVWCGK